MTRKTKIAISACGVIVICAGCAAVYGFFYLIGRGWEPPPTTSANAAPSDVAFLTLPSDARSVRYWDHWHNRIAVFETSEVKFRAIFLSIAFAEIREPKSYYAGGFDDPSNSPWKQNIRAETSSGLFYEKIADNGGGEMILYDRKTGTGSYEYAAW